MVRCPHTNLALLPERKHRVRCLHCHLTIEADALGGGFCPECHERTGKKRYDFEELEAPGGQPTRYRCEACGTVVEAGGDRGNAAGNSREAEERERKRGA